MEIEKRTFSFTCEERKMQGHAAVFNQETDLGWMKEKIEPGAFKSSIKKDDIRALFNHDPNYVLGRSTSGTLKLSEDDIGLKIGIDPPDTQFARDLAVSIERGDINQMSFAFQVLEEEWIRGEKKEPDKRILKKVKLFDVSPVTYPAYEGTDIAMRSHEAWQKQIEAEKKPEENEPLQPDYRLVHNQKRKQLLRKKS
jgi:uncharacterized protein